MNSRQVVVEDNQKTRDIDDVFDENIPNSAQSRNQIVLTDFHLPTTHDELHGRISVQILVCPVSFWNQPS